MCNNNLDVKESNEDIDVEEVEKHLLWQADQLATIFENHFETPKEKLEYLCDCLKKMRLELANLEIGWDKYIPILHESALLYYDQVRGRFSMNFVRETSSSVMRSIFHLSQSGKFRKNMVYGYNQQIKDIENVLRIKYTDSEKIDQPKEGGVSEQTN